MRLRRSGSVLVGALVVLLVGGGVRVASAQSAGTTPGGSEPAPESTAPPVAAPGGGSTAPGGSAPSASLTLSLVADLPDMSLSDALVVGNDVLAFASGDAASVVKLNAATGAITGFFGFGEGEYAREFLQVGSDLFIPVDTAAGGCDIAKVDPATMALTTRAQLSATTSCRSTVPDETKPGVVWGLLEDYDAKTLVVATVNVAGGPVTAVDITAQVPADYTQQGLELAGGFGFVRAVPGYDDAGQPKMGLDGKPLPDKFIKIDGATVTSIDLPAETAVVFADGKIWLDGTSGTSLIDPVTLKIAPTTEKIPYSLYGVLVDGPFVYDFYRGSAESDDRMIGKFDLATAKLLAETKIDTGFPTDAFPSASLFKAGSERYLMVSMDSYNSDTQKSTRHTKVFKVEG